MLAKGIINLGTVLLAVALLYFILFHWVGPRLLRYYRKLVNTRRAYDAELADILKEPQDTTKGRDQ